MSARISLILCTSVCASAVQANADCSLQACTGTCREPGQPADCLTECLKASQTAFLREPDCETSFNRPRRRDETLGKEGLRDIYFAAIAGFRLAVPCRL
jgi:hypothetical protein